MLCGKRSDISALQNVKIALFKGPFNVLGKSEKVIDLKAYSSQFFGLSV